MAQVSFRIDDKIKRDAEQVCDDIGISMSAAITIYLKRLGKERRIPFDLVADPFYSAKPWTIEHRSLACKQIPQPRCYSDNERIL